MYLEALGDLVYPALEDRPREKLSEKGLEALSDTELLSLILNTGIKGKNVKTLAGELLDFLDQTCGIPPVKELAGIAGLGECKAGAVAAMLEFGRRRYSTVFSRVKSPHDIFLLVRHYADRKQERFVSVSLNGAHEVLAVRVITVGLLNKAIVHPREVFADLIHDRAAAFCLAHNHPSGSLECSGDDDETNARMEAAAELLGINFVDHLIFSQTDWWSFRENKKLKEHGPR